MAKTHAPCAAVVLSGGLNTRMGGQNKAFLEVGGQQILDRLLDVLQALFEEILLVTRQPELYRGRGLKVVTDIFAIRSSLTGIHAGLANADADHAFMVACDTPFLKGALVKLLLDELEPRTDLVIPAARGRYQPLCAIYSKRCIEPIEQMLRTGDLKIINLFSKITMKKIPLQRLRKADAQLRSFFNVNSPEELRQTEKMLRMAFKGRLSPPGPQAP